MLNLLLHGVDALAQFGDEKKFLNTIGGYVKDVGTVLELYRASQIMIFPNELILEKQNSWSRHFLKQQVSNGSMFNDRLHEVIGQEVISFIDIFLYYFCLISIYILF